MRSKRRATSCRRLSTRKSAVQWEIRTMDQSARRTQMGRILFLSVAALCMLSPTVMAQTGETPAATDSAPAVPAGWLERWMRNVDEARASQPHYVAPLVTTHVILVEQYRYDISRQQDATGGTASSNFGASRGLEIIPTTRLEIGISPPPYFTHQSAVPR